MSDRVQGINRDDGLKVSRLRATEPARRLEGWEREAKGANRTDLFPLGPKRLHYGRIRQKRRKPKSIPIIPT